MTKAKLTGGQVIAAVFAGIFGHLLFAAGWIALGLVLLSGLIFSLLGVSLSSIFAQFLPQSGDFFDSAGGILGGVFIGFLVGAVVLMLLGFLVSGWILRGGKVRRPWATTWSAVLIVALLNLPLLLAYAAISSDQLPFPLVAVLGTLIVGVLVWLWMTWGHRGPASEFAGVSVSGSAKATPVEAAESPAVEASTEAPAAEKP